MQSEGKVNPVCVNASNPYHQCANYCVQQSPGCKSSTPRTLLASKSVAVAQNGERRKGDKRGVVADRRNVDPLCVNAFNPYHQCADYCTRRTPSDNRPNGVKSGFGAGESKGALKIVERKDVSPNCENASNPYHKCADYCLQKMNESM